MILHDVKVHPSKANLKREDQLAWKIAAVAADKVPVERDVAAMIVNRVIDNAAVAIAAINRHPVVSARDMALGHPHKDAATVFGVTSGKRVSPEWAAWANGTAIRELDMHDTSVTQRRDQLVEGVRTGACRQARGGSGGSRHARRRRAKSDLRR